MTETKTYCDRCGKEIKPCILPQGLVTLRYSIKFGYGSHDYFTSTHELCSDCVKALDKFLKGEEK